MQFIQADCIFPVTMAPIRNGIIGVDDTGIIRDILNPETSAQLPSPDNIQKHGGFLCPGFVNCHCHLELSYLKGKIPQHKGLTGFLKGLLTVRNLATMEEILDSISLAEEEMIKNGIVAVGDIANSSDSFIQKSKNNMLYHTFIELYDLGDNKAEETYFKGLELQRQLVKLLPENHNCSMVPHAPYTVSKKLFSLIDNYAFDHNAIISMHNQESEGENELFVDKSGSLFDFFTTIGTNMDFIQKTGVNSLRSTLVKLSKCNKIMLVHNTYTNEEDIKWAVQHAKSLYWCLCVKANLYIENRVPDIKIFSSNGKNITLGTDSLASNNCLSILEEIKTIISCYPAINFNDVLRWGTFNGADFLGVSHTFGSLEVGKKPGINLINNTDAENQNITMLSEVKKLF